MYLMLKDTPILYFNLDEYIVEVLNPDLVPFSIRYAFDNSGTMKGIMKNIDLVRFYLSSRVLSLSRDNAKKIYTMFNIPQLNDINTRVKICIACNGVSVTDSYWVKHDDDKRLFSQLNIRDNNLKSILDVSLYGNNPTISTLGVCPELTTHGLFRKSWLRDEDGLWLLKSDKTGNNINTRMEVLSSKVLDCFTGGIRHVEYVGRVRNTSNGKLYVDKCKNFVGNSHSFVEAWEVIEYCNRMNISFQKDILGYTKEAASIGVLDFILVNTDRHTQNYGFFMNNDTGVLEGLVPLFDFNLALISDLTNGHAEDSISQMFNSNVTLRQIAEHYIRFTSLCIDMKKFNKLRNSNKEYSVIFDNILSRCDYLGISRV